MSTIHLHRATRLTPEQYIAGLTDFGPGRSKLLATAPMNISRCITTAARRQMSRKTPEAFGSVCIMTGQAQTTWFL